MGIIRKTKSVKTLLNLFEQHTKALSVVELVEQLKQEMNKTTVYRILERLEDDGQIHSFKGKDGLTWYAKCSDCSAAHHNDTHPHFQCRKCGKMECLEMSVSIPKIKTHKVDSEIVLLIGECDSCLS